MSAQIIASSLWTNWEVKCINCNKLVKLHGQLHCISYNVPHFVSMEGVIRKYYPKITNAEL